MINPKIVLGGKELKNEYYSNEPFPNIVLEDFLDPTVYSMAVYSANELTTKVKENAWRFGKIDPHAHQLHKKGISNVEYLPTILYAISHYMNSPVFIEFLRDLTGIDDLVGDIQLEGGGFHVTERGGKLGIHHDFTKRTMGGEQYYRHVNLLIYLNDVWDSSWGGDLELWSPDLTEMVKRIPLKGNTAVLFNIDNAPHGHPHPLDCPIGETRRSLAFYYYSKQETLMDLPRAYWKVGKEYR